MTVLVTGGTGFIGRAILPQLRRNGHDLRLLVHNARGSHAAQIAREHGAQVHEGSVLRPESLAGCMRGVGAVIHLVGIISEMGASTFESIHREGTRHVLAAAKQAGVGRWIHMSALGARHKARSRYHATKWEAEELVRTSGLAHTIFRPSIVYGPEDRFVNLLAGLSKWSPVVPIMGSGRSKLQPIAVNEVARAFAGALDEAKSVGGTFDLCGSERLEFSEVLGIILEVVRRRRLILRIPLPLARVQAAMMEAVFPVFMRRPSPLSREQLIMLEEDNVGDPQPARELFRLELTPFRKGIAAYL